MEHRKEEEGFKSSTVEYGQQSPETNTYHTTTHEETNVKEPGKFKRNLRKYWWLHCISFILSTILISMLLSYVMLPAIAQKNINDAQMYIEEQIVADPTPDEVTLHVLSRIVTHTPFRPDLDSFTAQLFLEDTLPNLKAFGAITIPKVHATANFTQTVTQRMKIQDMEQFIRFNTLVLKEKKFRLGVRGKTVLRLGKLPATTVDFNKAPDLAGFNGFAGMEVRDIKISLTADENGNNMNGTLYIPNPTVFTITAGDVVQDIYYNNVRIGNTTINNMILKPGDNFLPILSSADQAVVIDALTKPKEKTGILPVEARAVSVMYKGKSLEYFKQAMAAVPIKLNLSLKEPLKAIGLDLDAIKSEGA